MGRGSTFGAGTGGGAGARVIPEVRDAMVSLCLVFSVMLVSTIVVSLRKEIVCVCVLEEGGGGGWFDGRAKNGEQ